MRKATNVSIFNFADEWCQGQPRFYEDSEWVGSLSDGKGIDVVRAILARKSRLPGFALLKSFSFYFLIFRVASSLE